MKLATELVETFLQADKRTHAINMSILQTGLVYMQQTKMT